MSMACRCANAKSGQYATVSDCLLAFRDSSSSASTSSNGAADPGDIRSNVANKAVYEMSDVDEFGGTRDLSR